ncbi:MAG: hypothetical protein RBT47_08140 [Anaerolineae bacterium]|jgi:hypothetical protein|nr:hypothetical protein [Anaerolineae bacterium]
MDVPQIFSNRQFRGVAIAVALLTLVLVVMNLFVIGGGEFLSTFNTLPDAPLATAITLVLGFIWFKVAVEKQRRTLWAGLAIGFGMWAVAEWVWLVTLFIGYELPYPSIADFFWLFGYIPLGIGLLARVRSMHIKPTPAQTRLIWGAFLFIVLLATVFVFVPIVQDFDPQRSVEFVINLLYPLGDLFLTLIVLRLFFTYEKGNYGAGWRFLAFGFLFMTLSDLVYLYGTWYGLYYAEPQGDMFSRFGIDVPYTLSYVLIFLSLFALRVLLSQSYPVELGIEPKRVPTYGHVILSTKNDNVVIYNSPNFRRLFEVESVKGKPVAEVLMLSEQEWHDFFEKLRTQGKVADLPLQIQNRSGALYPATLCGMAVPNPQKEYSGSNFLLRVPVADVLFDEDLDQESKSLTRYLLEKCGSAYKNEIGQFLVDYHLAYIKVALNIASQQGGGLMEKALLDELSAISTEHGWPLAFTSETVLDKAEYPLDVLREALPVLVDTAKQFATRVTNAELVGAQMQKLTSQFSAAVHKDAAHYMEPKSEIRFADNR